MDKIALGVFVLMVLYGSRRWLRGIRSKVGSFDWFGFRTTDPDDDTD